ncbi:GNAT family N-acetyltransferase [Ferrimonas balearica]|uniref:GNAT family N-acetyltransferase n=1 Tax=Ferrimonas balearica TaxID=44012 RepID=UPI001C99EBE6|nr:GNAT family N-acetyltransferase [Ferrimonas balearica]MBY5992218.1 GNAT family N-acetyltransferase [Ferrimonas balearica]
MHLYPATEADLPELARLFDAYRQFYDCPPDEAGAGTFLAERLARGESRVFLARREGVAAGFVQLYPSFCSVEMVKILILYDLYVAAEHRGQGVAEALMHRATDCAREVGAARLDLLTAIDNHGAQRLYEKLGYRRSNQGFVSYSLTL